MDFTSDNICGVSEEILTALSIANQAEAAAPYGADAMSMSVQDRFSDLFGKPAFVFPVVTGTAANALALSACAQPWQAILTHEKAHIEVMECGAPEFITGGAKLIGLPGENGKLTVDGLKKAVRHSGQGCLHRSQVSTISLTQTTDAGTVYSVDELKAITSFAHEEGLFVHMDGARFANAVTALGCHAADLIEGVDVLSFGATKNGAMSAEAIVFFNEKLAKDFAFQVKRTGHIVSKSRFLSAQLEAYVTDDLWRRNAEKANTAAAYLGEKLSAYEAIDLVRDVESNLVFIEIEETLVETLIKSGVRFYSEASETTNKHIVRLVCGFSTRIEKIDEFLSIVDDVLFQKKAA